MYRTASLRLAELLLTNAPLSETEQDSSRVAFERQQTFGTIQRTVNLQPRQLSGGGAQ